MEITLPEYIRNPSGGRTFTQRGMYQDYYSKKFDALLLRENGKFDYKTYKDGKDYILYIKIPSETVEGFYYDIVFWFTPKDNDAELSVSLDNYNVKFFSNDPAFIFTYANVFVKNNFLIEDLKDKIGSKALKKEPTVTNPNKIVGYVKTFYFAYLYMKSKGLLNKNRFEQGSKRYFKTPFRIQVQNAQTKIDKRIELGKELSKRKRIEKTLAKTKPANRNIKGTHVRKTSTVRRTKFGSSIKMVKKTKRK